MFKFLFHNKKCTSRKNTCCVFILNIRTQNIETFRETSSDILTVKKKKNNVNDLLGSQMSSNLLEPSIKKIKNYFSEVYWPK